MKICKHCGLDKPMSEFHVYRKAPDGHRASCKECLKSYFRKYYQDNKERNEDRVRSYRRLPHVIEYQRKKAEKYYEMYRSDPEYKAKVRERQKRSFAKSPRGTLVRSLGHAMRRRPVHNPITIEELMEMFSAQDGKCALSGIKMTWFKGKILPTSLSLDRIDSNGDYTTGNVRLICHAINSFRGRMTDDEMFTMALALIGNMKKPKLRLVS